PAGGAVYAPAPGKSIVWLVDANARTVVPNALGGGGRAGAGPVKLAAKPTGSPVVIGSKLYVPVTRGIAVVDLKTGKPVSTIALPATPVALAVGPGNRLFAALFSSGKVAVIAQGKKPVLVAAGNGPVALATAAGNV